MPIRGGRYHRRVNDRVRSAANAPTTAAPPAADWHPEPELISIRDAATSREALRVAGADIWETALDYLYGRS